MKKIPLTNSKRFALVSDEDFEKVVDKSWYVDSRDGMANHCYYQSDGKKKLVAMHRLIFKCRKGMVRDHINHNRLDNRRENIRIVTVSQNIMNSKVWRKPKSSRFKGVSWHKKASKWSAYIRLKRKSFYLGLFLKETDAARAYNTAAIKRFGEFAFLNKLSS